MTRGDLVTVALPGAYGKPRPALVVQSDFFEGLPSVALLPLTSEHIEGASLLRIAVASNDSTRLRKPSWIMVDKISTVPRDKVGEPFGTLDEREMLTVARALAVFLGIG